MRRGWTITIAFSLACLGLLWVLRAGFGRNPHEVPFMLKGQPAPGFTLRRLDTNEPVSLSQFKGKPVAINFWASWCGPCKQEHPVLVWGNRQFGDQVQFLGVLFEDTPENARAALAGEDPGYPQLVDPLSHMSVDYGATGVPETYFITADGLIQDKFVGPIDPQSLTEHIRRLQAPATQQQQRQEEVLR